MKKPHRVIFSILFVSLGALFVLALVDQKNFSDNSKVPIAPSSFVNEKILKEKIKKGLPLWANVQVKEDLSKFEKIDPNSFEKHLKDPLLEATLFKIERGNVKLITKSGRTHDCEKFQQDYQYQTASAVICDMVRYLGKHGYLPDSEFLVGTSDVILHSSAHSFPIFAYAKDTTVITERDAILIPDWMNLRSKIQTTEKIKAGEKMHPWETKEKTPFWRGGPFDSSGFRKKLVSFSESHPKLVDAKFTYLVTETNKRIQKEEPVSLEDQLKYKYLISIDGVRCTWERLVWQLESNSLTLKHNSNQVQWFYKGLKPYFHYIPFSDETDLLKKVAWAGKHNGEVQSIIKNANNFVEDNLTLEDMYHYFIVLMEEYTKKLERAPT